MPKFFIYNGDAVSQDCKADLTHLLQDNFIDAPCDVMDWHVKQNFDGLRLRDAPTLVVPGGSMWAMYIDLQKEFDKVTGLVNNKGFHYIGSCAGAYLAGEAITVSSTTYERDDARDYRQISRIGQASPVRPGLGLLPGVSTFGPLYSSQFHCEAHKPFLSEKGILFPFMPYSYSIKPTDGDGFAALYLSGCGFSVSPMAAEFPVEIVATYQEALAHGQSPTYEADIPAVLYKSGHESTAGNVLVSSAHLETCVPNSQILKALSTIDSAAAVGGKLSDFETFQLESEATKLSQAAFVGDALKRMYSPRVCP